MKQHEGNKPILGGHKKFVFRYGWLKKGIDAISRNPAIFTEDRALVALGVGKNMAQSIRYWCLATGLCEETHDRGPARQLQLIPLAPQVDLYEEARGKDSARQLQLTPLATRLMTDTGWDPYLEDIGTLWLLHWQITTNSTHALVWYLTFCSYYEPEFTKQRLVNFIDKQLTRHGIAVTAGAVEREVDVCLRTYVPAMRSAPEDAVTEETLNCPLAELDLLRFSVEDEVYRFNIGPKATLPVHVFGYALFTFLSDIALNRRAIAVDECIYKQGSPGQIFKLDENSVVEYLESLEELTEGKLRLQETAGLRQLYLDHDTSEWFLPATLTLLEQYYA